MNELTKGKCGCCRRDRDDIVGVASTMTAYSILWCRECLTQNTQPVEVIEYFIFENNGWEGCADWVKEILVFKDDKYQRAFDVIQPTKEKIEEFWKGYYESCQKKF
jgi:hypothetical protein